jgi:dolichol-phosphate mannosyltransferase
VVAGTVGAEPPGSPEEKVRIRMPGISSGEGPILSIVLPVFNEEGNIRAMYGRLKDVLEAQRIPFEIIFVDDGSTDGSLGLIRSMAAADGRVRFASFTRNFGHEAASSCGLEMVQGQAAVLMDCDLQDPPEMIPEMVTRWHEGFEVVFAQRTSRVGEGLVKRVTSSVFYRLMRRFSEIRLPRDVGDFRLMDRCVVDAFNRLTERNRFVRGLLFWVGFRQTGIPYDRPPRGTGRTKYNWTRLVLLSLDALFGFSLVPLRLCILTGTAVILLCLAIVLTILYQKVFLLLAIPGYALISTGIFFLGGVQLVFLGVIGEYVGKIYTEVQGRPLYIIRESS